MEFKKAVTICLLSFFSATLVLLIARTLDLQTAARLEPQLAQIVEELRSLRVQGGLAPAAGAAREAAGQELVVYYFHSNTRCPTCRSIESQALEAVQSGFAAEVADGRLAWKTLNYEEFSGRELAREFDVQMPVVVLARFEGGRVAAWRRLDQVWALVGKKPAFLQFVQDEIQQMLDTSPAATAAAATAPPDASPDPGSDARDSPPTAADDASGIPVPGEDLAVPE
jgi:hypothetical protein